MSKAKKLTVERLKQIIKEEKSKLKNPSDAETVSDAWSGGKNLVNQIDFIKKLGIKEAKLRERAKRISIARNALKKQILKDI